MDQSQYPPLVRVVFCGNSRQTARSLEQRLRRLVGSRLSWRTASSGLEAWRLSQSEPPDVVVLEEGTSDFSPQDFVSLARASDLPSRIVIFSRPGAGAGGSESPLTTDDEQSWSGSIRLEGPDLDQITDVVIRSIQRGTGVRASIEPSQLMGGPSSDAIRNPLKVELVRLLNHEFRNPVTITQTHLDYLEELLVDHQDPETSDVLSRARRSIQRVSELLDDCQELHEWWTRRRAVRLTRCAAADCVRTACSEVVDPTRVVRSADSTGAILWADPQIVTGMIRRLVQNALQHGGGAVAVATRLTASRDWELRVVDEGPGIPSEEAKRILDAFEVGDPEASTQGLGLGLAIVRESVLAFGGRMTLTSGPADEAADAGNRGMTVTVTLPVLEVASAEARIEEARETVSIPG